MKKSEELEEIIRRLKVIDDNCRDVAVDLRHIEFYSDDEEMYLTDLLTETKYSFKASPDNPKDPVRTQAHRQFCKMIDVPFQFFVDNRPTVRNQLVQQWLNAAAPKEGDEYVVILKIREGAHTNVIRAVLPVNYSVVPLHELVTTLSSLPGDGVVGVDEDSSVGVERDALVTQVRLIYNINLEEEYAAGIVITSSEVGGSDLIIDSFLYHKESKTYLVAQYGGQPFAKIQFAKVQPSEVQEMLSSVPDRVQEDYIRYMDSVNDSEESFPGLERACMLLSKANGVPKKLQRSILLEAQSCGDDMLTSKDFLRHAGLVAKNFDSTNRLKIERAAGSFGGLRYGKK